MIFFILYYFFIQQGQNIFGMKFDFYFLVSIRTQKRSAVKVDAILYLNEQSRKNDEKWCSNHFSTIIITNFRNFPSASEAAFDEQLTLVECFDYFCLIFFWREISVWPSVDSGARSRVKLTFWPINGLLASPRPFDSFPPTTLLSSRAIKTNSEKNSHLNFVSNRSFSDS